MKNNRGLLAIVTLAVVDLALLLTSGIPRFKNATEGTDYVIGQICWLGFLTIALSLIITSSLVLVRRLRGIGRGSSAR